MTEYEDQWITTFIGDKFHYNDPQEHEIHIRDIAHALSLKCRFSGHCRTFYSVGEHSIRVAEILPPELQLAGLLHDAAETYLPDIPRPIKYYYGLQEAEEKIIEVLQHRYQFSISKEIKEADSILLATEARDLMPNTDGWAELPEPLERRIVPMSMTAVELVFTTMFIEYGGKEL